MTVNHLLLTDVKQEEQDDELLASLTNIAYKIPSTTQVITKEKQRRSRFFFKPTISFASDFDKSKKAIGKKENTALTVLDAEVEDRKTAYAKELPKALKSNIEQVREFFLKDIGPLYLAAQAGTVQAAQVMQRTLNTEIDGQAFAQFERMVGKASTIKMARFVAKYLNLPQKSVEELLQVIQPPPPKEVLLMNNNPFSDEQQRRQRKEKAEPATPKQMED
jgi:D-alanyl-D-alanine carboxypeptidase